MPARHALYGACLLTAGLAATLAVAQSPVATPAKADPAAWPAARSPATLSSKQGETRIEALLARMTIEQKVGQMIQADIGSITPADLARYPLGSILAGGNSGPYGNERADAATWGRLVAEYRQASRSSGAGIPVLFGVDAVHGHSNLPGATIFPHNIGLGAARDPRLIRRIGAATAAEVAGSGIEWTFAPTLAVPQDLRWGRTYEGYAADPALVASYAREMTEGLQGVLRAGKPVAADRVAATAKHYLADGGTLGGKDQGDARIPETELVARHAQGYPAAIKAGALTVMASFSSWNGVKHHGNATLLTDVLKGRMGFKGLVVGDWNAHGQVPGCTVTDCPASFNAGLDLAMAPDSWKGLYETTLKQARDGTIPMARIDDAVRRILRVKLKLGLMDARPVERGNPAMVGSDAHLALAREAVAKSLVLLKNNGGLLPLKPGARVLVAGPGADNMAMQAGGWTITWQGTDTKAEDFPKGQTIGRAIAAAVKAGGGEPTIAPGGEWISTINGVAQPRPDVAVVVFGERPYAEFEGDAPDLAFRALAGEEKLVADLKAQGIPVVSLFLSGRPMFVGKLFNQSDAFVAGWLPGTQGLGVADVPVARRNGKPLRDFTGRLPFAWPQDAVSPITSPLFPAGYGLTYRSKAKVGPVNEDPRVDLNASSSATLYLQRGSAKAPWRLGLDSAVTARAVDLAAQEDARQFTWTAPGGIALDGPPVSLTSQVNAGYALLLDWRVDALPAGPVRLALGGGELDLGDVLRGAAKGQRLTTLVPLRCFQAAGGDLAAVNTPLRLRGTTGLMLTMREVRLEQAEKVTACPPQSR